MSKPVGCTLLLSMILHGWPLLLWGQPDVLSALPEAHNLAGMSVVSRCGDAISIQVNMGHRDIGRDLSVDENTTFRMASVSKGVVALVVAKLVEENQLQYDAPLGNYLDAPPIHPNHPNEAITLNHLLTHTSGIRDGSGYGDFLSASYSNIPNVPTLNSVLDPGGEFHTPDMWGSAAPGEWFQYANLNFGVLATVMEAATGMRFDHIMENHLFGPFGIDAGYRVQDLDNINDLAVLYRQNDGEWVPQADHYLGVTPTGPNWSEYIPGINAVCLSPQGGLRIGTEDLTVLARLWSSGTATGADGLPLPYLTLESLSNLKATQWTYDTSSGGNGNNYYGLFNSWARGLHLAASGSGNDGIVPDVNTSPFIGHPGEAYGLISDAYATPGGEWNFAFVTNGKWDGFTTGPGSAFYALEQDVFSALREDLLGCLSASLTSADPLSVHPIGRHRAGDTTLRLSIPTDWSGPFSVQLLDASGREATRSVGAPQRSGILQLSTLPLVGGWNIGAIAAEEGTPLGRFLLVVEQ